MSREEAELELAEVHAAVRWHYRPVITVAVLALVLLMTIGALGLLVDRPGIGSAQDVLELWWIALPRIGFGDALAVLAVLATVVIALSLTVDEAPRKADPSALGRDRFREEITVAASTMGMLAAFMGVLALVDDIEGPARFSTGPVGEALALLGLATALSAVAALADRRSSQEIRTAESEVRAHEVRRLEARLDRAGDVPASWVSRPWRALGRPVRIAAVPAGLLGVGAGAVVLALGEAPVSAGRALFVTVVSGLVTALLAALASAAVLSALARWSGRARGGVRRRPLASDYDILLLGGAWAVGLVVSGILVAGAATGTTVTLAWLWLAALLVPLPVWWVAGRRGETRRRLLVHGLLTDRVPALRETYSQAVRTVGRAAQN